MFSVYLCSEKAPSNLYTKLDVAEAIHPLRGPESILEHQLVEVQEEGAAASFVVTSSKPQNAKDDYSSEKWHYLFLHFISIYYLVHVK
mgnify:CR=1 FL=1